MMYRIVPSSKVTEQKNLQTLSYVSFLLLSVQNSFSPSTSSNTFSFCSSFCYSVTSKKNANCKQWNVLSTFILVLLLVLLSAPQAAAVSIPSFLGKLFLPYSAEGHVKKKKERKKKHDFHFVYWSPASCFGWNHVTMVMCACCGEGDILAQFDF